jgi:nucleotide-binding universal stress UspA family protein
MLKHILVPLDSSELAETALPYAKQILAEGGHITLLIVIQPPTLYLDDYGAYLTIWGTTLEQQLGKLRWQAQVYLNTIVFRLESMKGHIESIIKVGYPSIQIIELAKDRSIDAIVMSTHGKTGLSRWLLGSVTQKVVSAAPCPVFIIPPKE